MRRNFCRPVGSILNGYDLEAYAVLTQQEVADALGLSRARIQQLEQSGMRRLRSLIEARRKSER